MSVVEYSPRVPGLLRSASEPDMVDIERVAAVVHYVIAKADPGQLGHVKLNRILWYADLEHYRWHGVSMTGLRHYSRTPHGPISPEVSRAVAWLAKQGKAAEQNVKVDDLVRRGMISLLAPWPSALTEEQTDILDEIVNVVAPLTATQLNQIAYADRLWQEVKNNDPMPVATGSITTPPTAIKLDS